MFDQLWWTCTLHIITDPTVEQPLTKVRIKRYIRYKDGSSVLLPNIFSVSERKTMFVRKTVTASYIFSPESTGSKWTEKTNNVNIIRSIVFVTGALLIFLEL